MSNNSYKIYYYSIMKLEYSITKYKILVLLKWCERIEMLQVDV